MSSTIQMSGGEPMSEYNHYSKVNEPSISIEESGSDIDLQKYMPKTLEEETKEYPLIDWDKIE